MRCFLFFVLFVSFSTVAQNGSVLIKCLDPNSNKGVGPFQIEFLVDSTSQTETISFDGILLKRGLPPGNVRFRILPDKGGDTLAGTVFIQSKQLAQLNLYINEERTQLYAAQIGNHVKLDAKGDPNAQGKPFPISTLSSSSSVMEIQCVMVVAYRAPLISRDGGASGATIKREDISRLPVRSVGGIASTVGGVQSPVSDEELFFRGSRSGSTVYYLDGMRISDPNSIPRSFLGEVNVITGGIPANYGDLTGGVVDIRSRGFSSSDQLFRSERKRKRENETPVPAPVYDPVPTYKTLTYDHFLPIYENDFLSPREFPHSTFGLDVDRASWSFIKRQLSLGGFISRDAVKIEEMINSFKTFEIEDKKEELIQVKIERNKCEWNSKNELVMIHVKAQDLPRNEERKVHNLVFLVDVSGSMSNYDKLPLLVNGLKRFVKTLDERDRVAIVTYAGYSAVLLDPTKCSDQEKIIDALEKLSSGGSTNGIGGIMEAYKLAEKHYDPKLNNRIILCTDGDFNVGISSPLELERFIEQKRGQGIYLTALGFGMGNYKNSTLETLADKGDGNHFYISDLHEMHQVLSGDLGNLLNIARDVKLNVEFNPELVKSYRLIGYENRLLRPKDFMDDTKDGGEMGYGHTVTAVYEIERGRSELPESHFAAEIKTINSDELAFVKLRYKPFEEEASIERRYSLTKDQTMISNDLLNVIIGLGLHLRDSAFKGDLSIEQLKRLAKEIQPRTEDEFELKRIVEGL